MKISSSTISTYKTVNSPNELNRSVFVACKRGGTAIIANVLGLIGCLVGLGGFPLIPSHPPANQSQHPGYAKMT